MDVSEKLVELLAPTSLNFEEAEYLADYLVKNGITVQGDKDINVPTKWISVTERLPEPKHEFDARNWYLVALSNGVVKELAYEFHNHSVFGYGWRETAYPVTHWMPLPEPQKGE